ncbi:MAG: dienelactone hydrolase family protein [Chloroflexi bacterium]|nr:dienelactone hydrolase family protein [Chloroflexota bacterium]MBP8056925.1 dienelactone hydrolase family protein [Chloroflexota bacterium]
MFVRASELMQSGLAAATLIHRLARPHTPGPHPTLVMIHGHKGNEEVMWIFSRTVPENWLLVAPRAPIADGIASYSWLEKRPPPWPTLHDFHAAADQIAAFITALPQQYNADPERIYLMGFSQGAAALLATIMFHPGLVQAAALLVGFAPEQVDGVNAAALEDLPIFMAIGTKDDTVPYEQAQKGANLIAAAGANLTLVEMNTGHKLDATGMKALQAWWGKISL